MKIVLLDRNPAMTTAWESCFHNEPPDVEIVCDEFTHFMRNHHVDCVVSPGNAYGLMDGGYDLAITRWFGDQLQKRFSSISLTIFVENNP